MKYLWFKDHDTSRSPYAAFRASFDVQELKRTAFHIFADTVYTLFVNGVFIGFGPTRFDPRFPQYDTYDLHKHLRMGKNVIAVLVNYHGHKVFKSIPREAAFTAWGDIPLVWKCKEHTGHTQFTPKLSFALETQIHYNQGGFDENWINTDYDDSDWQQAVPLANQNAYGKLTPREIPFMELTPIKPASVTVFPLEKRENVYSFYLPTGTSDEATMIGKKFIAWSTYVYSPKKQTITAGVFYDSLWVNGSACEKTEDYDRAVRYNAVMHLDEGWNYVFGQLFVYQDIFQAYLSLPVDCGLLLSADKDESSGFNFRHIPLQDDEKDNELKSMSMPLTEDFDATRYGGWVYTTEADRAQCPIRASSWTTYAPPVQTITDLSAVTFKKEMYPNGFTLLVDMDHMCLVFPLLHMRGMQGATVDFLYGDRFMADGKHLRSLSWVPLGDRVVCANDALSWQPIQPRGFKYVSITINNAPSDVVINKIDFLSAHYPVNRIGSFECSDPLLNRIWQSGELTLRINMEDTYTDCVDRERGLYALDLLVQYCVNLATFGDHALMKRALELYGQSNHEPTGVFRCLYPNTGDYVLPDFCLYIVHSFHAYFKQTNDIAFIKTYWPAMMENIARFNRLSDEREDKLLNAEWPEGGWPPKEGDNRMGFLGDGIDSFKEALNNTGINCMFSAMYLLALRNMQEMATATQAADDFSARIAILEKSIPDAYWNEEKNLFADNLDHADFSPHASLWAVLAGAATNEHKRALQTSIPPLLTPFFINGVDFAEGCRFETSRGFHLFVALYELGLDNLVEQLIKEGWGYFLDKGLKTTPEHFSLSASQCHAWTAHPTYMLTRYALGISIDANGEVKMDPRPGTLTWAKGTVPHPNGVVEAEWHLENGKVIAKYNLIRKDSATIL
ncbi:MAG: hypothetical protein FWC71_03345 [Defluviitaleaceae bacterium]|nr:hypothetical protein [Defluviitaleaceae bacterium]